MNNHQPLDPLSQGKEFWRTIVLHRWGILLAAVLLAGISIVVITLLPDHYEARTTVFFDPQSLPERYVTSTVTADPTQRLNTLTEQVLNTDRLQQISQQLQLFASPHPSADAIAQMKKAITIEMKQSPEHEISAFAIKYTAQDPQMAATVANQLAQSFIDWDLANREQQARNTAEFLAAQLQDAKQVEDAEEGKIKDYKLKHIGELPEELQSNMQALGPLHASLQANGEALDKLEQEKTMLTAVPEAARSLTGAPSERDRLETEQRTLQAELANLRAEYTDQYPDVVTTKERLETLANQLKRTEGPTSATRVSSAAVRLEIINREIERRQDERKKLIERISQYQARLDATAGRGQELEILSRNYNIAQGQYEGLLDKKFHAEMAMELESKQKASRFMVVPAQVPDTPVKPNRTVLFALVLPLCSLLPMGLVIAAAEMRGTVNSERALRSLLPDSARVVGNIPMIETPSRVRSQRRLAILSILGSLLCCAAVAAFLWGGGTSHARRNHARQLVPSTPSAKLSSP